LNRTFIRASKAIPYGFTGIAIRIDNKDETWFLEGEEHRLDGPAFIGLDGLKEWFVNGKLHRLDGPAQEWLDGQKFWYVDGKEITELECKLLCDTIKLKGLI
jgi:hypothetical protein